MSKNISKIFVLMMIKYLFSIVLIVCSATAMHEVYYLGCGFAELSLIIVLTEIIRRYHHPAALGLNVVCIFLLNVEYFVLCYSSSWVNMIMINSLSSVSMLRGKAVIYGISALLVVIIALLPISEIKMKEKHFAAIFIIVFAEILFQSAAGDIYSPFYALYDLADTACTTKKMERSISMKTEGLDIDNKLLQSFYHEEIQQGYEKPANLSDSPNIILIFTEGLSQNIVEDERNIMPNVRNLQNKSLNFVNYFNHTAATYNGIMGQLYSGYQLSDNGENKNPLSSLQSVLSAQGYDTAFINSEPWNRSFTNFLESMGFDEVITKELNNKNPSMEKDSVYDKEMYEQLFSVMEKKIGTDDGTPQFIAMYTFGTHASFDSQDKKYDNGEDRILNRFYNADYHFGIFMDKFEDSSMADNTIIIFTADHATYNDQDFQHTFYPDYVRTDNFCDRIPFSIYYRGVKAETIDAKGKNSLNMVPTLLDFLDINEANFFMGNSLFLSDETSHNLAETVFAVPSSNWYISSKDEILRELTEEELNLFIPRMQDYLTLINKE